MGFLKNKVIGGVASLFRKHEETIEDIDEELSLHYDPALLEIDINNALLTNVQEFYNVTTVPYLILMQNYDILYEGEPRVDRIWEIVNRDQNAMNRVDGLTELQVGETTVVTEEIEGGLKKIITTNTKTVTEPELVVEVDPAEYDVFEFYDDQVQPDSMAIVSERVRSSIPGYEDLDESQIKVQKVERGDIKKLV